MRAFVIPHAGADTRAFAEIPIPEIGTDEILLRVHAVGVGIHDPYFLPEDAQYPYAVGIEAAGVIAQIGGAVRGHAVGDRVAVVSSMQPKGGTWAEYVAVSARSLILPIPDAMSYTSASAVPVAGNTILKVLTALPHVAGSLFINGSSGAIGTLAIQLARRRGWRVAASASASNQQYMRDLGAEFTVDYANPEWPSQVLAWQPGGVDAAIAIQRFTTTKSLPVVTDGGTLISVSGDAPVSARGVHSQGVPYAADVHEDCAQLLRDIDEGSIRVEIAAVFPFEDAAAALAQVQTGHARGKVVIEIAP